MKPGGWKRLPHAVCLWPILRCLSRGVLAGLFEIVDSIAFGAGYLPGTRDVCDLRHEKEERKGDEEEQALRNPGIASCFYSYVGRVAFSSTACESTEVHGPLLFRREVTGSRPIHVNLCLVMYGLPY